MNTPELGRIRIPPKVHYLLTFVIVSSMLYVIFTLLPTTHLTYGIGLPTATQVIFKSDPAITLYSGSGGIENLGFTRRTIK